MKSQHGIRSGRWKQTSERGGTVVVFQESYMGMTLTLPGIEFIGWFCHYSQSNTVAHKGYVCTPKLHPHFSAIPNLLPRVSLNSLTWLNSNEFEEKHLMCLPDSFLVTQHICPHATNISEDNNLVQDFKNEIRMVHNIKLKSFLLRVGGGGRIGLPK